MLMTFQNIPLQEKKFLMLKFKHDETYITFKCFKTLIFWMNTQPKPYKNICIKPQLI